MDKGGGVVGNPEAALRPVATGMKEKIYTIQVFSAGRERALLGWRKIRHFCVEALFYKVEFC